VKLKYLRLDRKNRSQYENSIAELEKIASYPLGEDRFTIDHGSDYFAFFDRLGETVFHIYLDGPKVVALGAAVLRTIPNTDGKEQKVWYLCDLKVHPDCRGAGIPIKMANRGFLRSLWTSRRLYGISMDQPRQKQNRVAKLLNHFKWLPINIEEGLEIYQLSLEQLNNLDLIKYVGEFSSRSLISIKDIVLESTGNPLNLWHVQHGCKAQHCDKQGSKDGTYMICSPEHSRLSRYLKNEGIPHSSTATIIHSGMNKFNWDFILTSDI
jgi:hypothetical protein